MANQGKRMVPEYLIKKIGEGGGGTEYTAGTGIDITEDVISVDTETVALKSDLATVATTGDYDDLTNKPTIPVVEANSASTPTATLTNLDVDGTVYSIATGTTVVANSTATPSATLTTLQVGSDTYEVPQGGSTPSNMVTTDTDQTINANKTIGANKIIDINSQYCIRENGIFPGSSNSSAGIYLRNYERCKGVISFAKKGDSTTNPAYPVTSTNSRYNFNIHLANGGVDAIRSTYIFDPAAIYYTKSYNGEYGADGANLGTSAYLFKDLYLSGNITNGTNTVSVANLKSVSGTNDGTNWTSLTVGNDTYAIPSGGSGSTKYTHNIHFGFYSSSLSKYVIDASITLESDNSNTITTFSQLAQLIYNNIEDSNITCTGIYDDSTKTGAIVQVATNPSVNQLIFVIYKNDGTADYPIITPTTYEFALLKDKIL